MATISRSPWERPFGALLQRYRRAVGLTQEELAERASLSARAIAALEQGVNQTPHKETLRLLAEALALSPQQQAALESAARRPASGRILPSGPPVQQETAARVPLIGRAGELALVERHLAGSPEESPPPVLLLAGEPGIGKTRLLHDVAGRAAGAGWTVLRGGCQRRGGQEPYAPLPEALERYLEGQTPAQRRAVLRGCAWLVRLLPELAAGPIEPLPLWTVSPAQERRLMCRSVATFLANVAGPAGTLLVLDDLQWAGPDALDLLALLLRTANALVRVVGAYRDSEREADDPLAVALADLAHAGLVHQHTLAPLAPEAVGQLLTALLEGTPGDRVALADQVARRAGGVPFFLVSCVQCLRGGTADGPSAGVPWTVTQSVRQRVMALPEAAREVVGVAAVAGRVVPYALLLALMGRPRREVLMALESACRARLLEAEGPAAYRFAHDLIREVVEADLGAAQRGLLHRDIAAALETLPGAPSVEALAFHYAQTDEHARAAHWLERAGDQAALGYANLTAIQHYCTAREKLRTLGADAGTLSRLDEKSGDLYILLGDYAQAQEDFRRARTGATSAEWRAELWRKEGVTWTYRSAFPAALAAFDAAEAEAEPGDPGLAADAARARADAPFSSASPVLGTVQAAIGVSRAAAYYLSGDLVRAHATAERLVRGLSAAQSGADGDRALGGAYHYLGEVAVAQDDLGQGQEYYRRSLALRQRAGEQEEIAWSWNSMGCVSWASGDLARAQEEYQHCLAIMEHLGHQWGLAEARVALALVSLGRGDLGEAEDLLWQSLAVYDHMTPRPVSAVLCWVLLGWIACEQGALATGSRRCGTARRLLVGADDVLGIEAGVACVQARTCLRRGRLRAAARLVEYARGILAPRANWLQIWLSLHLALVAGEAQLRQGDFPAAQATAEELLGAVLRDGRRLEEALARRLLGRCALLRGATTEVQSHLRAALAIQMDRRAALEAARTRLALAEALVAGAGIGHIPAEARTLLREAQAQFATSGAALDEVYAERLTAQWTSPGRATTVLTHRAAPAALP
jgi:transcriptional regulator with XRE-family HTH domain